MNGTITDHKNILYPPGGILIWIIIFLELITFGAALVAMVYSGSEEPEIFHSSKSLLNETFGAINTIFLIGSGFCMAQTVHYFKQQSLNKSSVYLKLAILGGFLFLCLKGYEYANKIQEGYTVDYNTFFTYYWMLTLFHLVHVLVGMGILVTLLFDVQKKGTNANLENIEAGAAFWHMCDLIWILIFPIIYLIF